MNFDDLATILVDELDAERADDTVTIGAQGPKVTLLVGTTDGVMPVPKVKSVRATESYLAIETDAGHTFIGRGNVFAVRAEDAEPRGSSRPGFA